MKRLATLVILSSLVTACGGNKQELPVLTPQQENAAMVRFLERYDTNRDGEITCEDATLKRAKEFDEIDKDGNGQLDAGEYRYAKFQDRSFLYIELSDVDTDQSLTVSQPEFTAIPDGEYVAIDRNRDCITTRPEIILAAQLEIEKRLLRGEGLGKRRGPSQERDKGEKIEEIDGPPDPPPGEGRRRPADSAPRPVDTKPVEIEEIEELDKETAEEDGEKDEEDEKEPPEEPPSRSQKY